jgi:outer membrane protein OmpA-like peptidoglycan-associated protein
MGESYMAIADGTSALQYNPAGLASMDRGEASATSIMWFDNINMIHAAAGYPLAEGFGIAGSVLWINYGNFDSTGGIESSVSMQDGLINIGAAKSFGGSLNIGAELRGLYESFSAGTVNSSSIGFSVNGGATLQLGSRNLVLGLTAANLGILSGAAGNLPAEAGAGLGWRLYDGSFNYMNMDIDLRKILNSDEYYAGFGFEGYVFRAVALRFGVHYNNAFENSPMSLSNIQNLVILSAGAGININDFITIDYAFTPMGDLGEVQRLTLRVKFGDSISQKTKAGANERIVKKVIAAPEVSVSDGEIKAVSFKPDVPRENVKEWSLSIKTSDGKIIKTFSGVGEVPKTLNWDGTDAYGRIAKSDVNYVFDFNAKNDEGKTINSTGDIIQPKQPDFVMPLDKRFVPQNGKEVLVVPVTLLVSTAAQERKSVPFVMASKKVGSVKDWEFKVYDRDKTLLRKISGDGALPSYLVWDGKDSFGNYAHDLKNCRYALVVNGTDGKNDLITAVQPMRDTFVISTDSKIIEMAPRIYFERNSAVISAAMMQKLDDIAINASKYRNLQVYIQGHSSAEGDSDFNMNISRERAKSVLRYLVEKRGLSPLSMSTAGYGAEVPLADGKSEDANVKNRRVEIILIGDKQ